MKISTRIMIFLAVVGIPFLAAPQASAPTSSGCGATSGAITNANSPKAESWAGRHGSKSYSQGQGADFAVSESNFFESGQ